MVGMRGDGGWGGLHCFTFILVWGTYWLFSVVFICFGGRGEWGTGGGGGLAGYIDHYKKMETTKIHTHSHKDTHTHRIQLCPRMHTSYTTPHIIHAYMYAHINPVTKQVSKICILFTVSLLKFCIDSVEKQNFFQMMWNGMFFPLKKHQNVQRWYEG